jgi:hypothetical protein
MPNAWILDRGTKLLGGFSPGELTPVHHVYFFNSLHLLMSVCSYLESNFEESVRLREMMGRELELYGTDLSPALSWRLIEMSKVRDMQQLGVSNYLIEEQLGGSHITIHEYQQRAIKDVSSALTKTQFFLTPNIAIPGYGPLVDIDWSKGFIVVPSINKTIDFRTDNGIKGLVEIIGRWIVDPKNDGTDWHHRHRMTRHWQTSEILNYYLSSPFFSSPKLVRAV